MILEVCVLDRRPYLYIILILLYSSLHQRAAVNVSKLITPTLITTTIVSV